MGGSLVLYIAQLINYGDKARMGDYGIFLWTGGAFDVTHAHTLTH